MMSRDGRSSFSVRFARQAWLPALMLLGGCATTAATSTTTTTTTTTPSPEPKSGGPAVEGDVRAKLQAVLDQAAAFEKSPGMVMAVQIGNTEPMYFVTGYQDESKTLKMTPEMNFRVGSITKNFVGTAILQQVDEGKISLDDTLEKWLPGVFSNINGNNITIREMLRHTSGIESYTNAYSWSRIVYTDPTHVWNAPTELLKLTQNLRAHDIKCGVVVPPGSEFVYSNTNFILLGMIAAKVDGYAETDWQKVIEQRFFKRLHMNDSRIPTNEDNGLGSTNHGYVNFYNFYLDPSTGTSSCTAIKPPCVNSDIDFTQQNMSNAWSAGAIMSTAKDLLGWLNAELKGDLLSEKIRKEQQTFINSCKSAPATGSTAAQPAAAQSAAGPVRRWLSMLGRPQKTDSPTSCEPVPTNCEDTVQVGLAIFRQTKYGFIGHRGEIFGFDNTIQYLPEKDLTVVVLSNRTALSGNNVGPVPEQVAAVLYPDLKPQDGSAPAISSTNTP